ncbi:hypothetical protein B296_00057619 [Ensete ventricosum]|uniref:Uncharacterized protein n=1 Tax=Ensete ventricosum TaxID=4639 RepID=A0A426WX39_ENSVE|nr:hypothetical protein B296_00057619 [Ensete ventricosum]
MIRTQPCWSPIRRSGRLQWWSGCKGQSPVVRATAYKGSRWQELSPVGAALAGTTPIGRLPASRGSARGGTTYGHGARPRAMVAASDA